MTLPAFDTWLFDLDGTLVDSMSAVVACMKQTALDMGGEVTDEIALKASFGKGLVSTLIPWVPEGRADEAIEQYMRNFPHYVQNNIKLHDGVIELLDLLQERGIPMAVVTGNKQSEADGLYEKLGVGQYFPVTICADTIPFQKPSPEPVVEACKRLGVEPSNQVVFIGDSEHDIRAGKLAGVKTIAVLGGSSPEDRLRSADPDWVFEGIEAVLSVVAL